MINTADLSPKTLEAMTGIPPEVLRLWRNRGFLDGIGRADHNGRWKYTIRDAVKLALANALRLSGVPPKVAVMIGWDDHDDILLTAGFYRNRACDHDLLVVWNAETGDLGSALTSRYFPWTSYHAQNYEEIRLFIDAPAPIVADLHKICKELPDPLKSALKGAKK